MSALEREIIEKFHQLQPAAKKRVLALIEQEVATENAEFDYATWFSNVETIHREIYSSQSDKQAPIDTVGALRDIRDGEDE